MCVGLVQKQSEPAPTLLVSVRLGVERTRITGYFLSLLVCSVAGCPAGFTPCFDSDLGCPPFAMTFLLSCEFASGEALR